MKSLVVLVALANCVDVIIGGQCVNGTFDSNGITPADIEVILKLHNEQRQITGADANNMLRMDWDEDLAKAAQAHADNCEFRHYKIPANNYNENYGQNLCIRRGSSFTGTVTNWTWCVSSWNAEGPKFLPENRSPFKYNESCDHFTQDVWAKTYRVGCGKTKYNETYPQGLQHNLKFSILYTCNYGPPGNQVPKDPSLPKTEMYHQGKPGSDPSCTLDDTYTNLCKPPTDGPYKKKN